MFYILLSIILVLVLVRYLRFWWKFRCINEIPGPKTVPIFGNILELRKFNCDFIQSMNRLVKEYGPILRMWFGPFSPTVIISSGKNVEKFLASSIHVQKTESYELFKDWFGNGIFSCDEETWRLRRKLLTPTYMQFKFLDTFLQIFVTQTDILLDKLREAAEQNEVVNIDPYINRYTLDNICETSMGISINAQDNPNLEYISAIRGAIKCHITRYLNLLMKNDFLFKFTKTYRLQKKYLKSIIAFTEGIIERRKAIRKKKVRIDDENIFGKTRRTVFLDFLLDLEDAKLYTAKDVREEVDTFLFGGHDTVASCISFTLYNLSLNRKIQEEVYQEIKAHYDGSISSSFLQNLSLLERVIKETLRIYPIVTFFERKLTQEIEMDGFKIPTSTSVAILVHLLHHSEEYFPDPMKFDPDRFLPENCEGRSNYVFLPFGGGPRNCMGQRYTWLLVKTCLVQILTDFEVFPVPGFQLDIEFAAVIKSKNGVNVILRRRNH